MLVKKAAALWKCKEGCERLAVHHTVLLSKVCLHEQVMYLWFVREVVLSEERQDFLCKLLHPFKRVESDFIDDSKSAYATFGCSVQQ